MSIMEQQMQDQIEVGLQQEEYLENYGKELYTLKINKRSNGTFNFHGYSHHFGEDFGFEIGGVDYNSIQECVDIALEQFEYEINSDL